MEVRLKVLVGSSAGQTIKIAGPKFYVGRSEECQLRPRSDLISRHHCVLIVEGEYVGVRDFGSKNGTYVNGQRVTGEHELKGGDNLKIGPLEFEVVIDVGLGGQKKPKVKSIKEAAERTADSGVVNQAQLGDDLDLSEWLGDDLVGDGGDTREMPEGDTAELTMEQLTTPNEPAAPPKPDDKTVQDDPRSDEAAAEMLRKLRRFR